MLKKFIILSSLIGFPAAAHEFWIEPMDYTIAEGKPVVAEVRSGEYFSGEMFPYMPERIVKTELVGVLERAPITGSAGDVPAIRLEAESGFQVLSYQSTPAIMSHQSFSGFKKFLAEDGLQWVEAAHRQRNLPLSGFKEKYTRYAKSLVSVNGVDGYDQTVGLPYELVVKTRLYNTDDHEAYTIQLLAHGKPVSDAQVTVFQKVDGATDDRDPLKLITDKQGHVVVPVGEGGSFLASSVIMTQGTDVPWHSHWASVTFSSL